LSVRISIRWALIVAVGSVALSPAATAAPNDGALN
jgi:hypothetical protein